MFRRIPGDIPRFGEPSGLVSVQVFTASGTWTRPAGIKRVLVEVVGPGGGGGGVLAGTASQMPVAGGGGAGAQARKLIDVSSIASATITVESGGSGGAAGANNGANGGGASVWSDGVNTLTANPGQGGTQVGVGADDQIAPGGAGGDATGGDTNMRGGHGDDGVVAVPNNDAVGGNGGQSALGAGGQGNKNTGAGTNAPANSGAGGGGAAAQKNQAAAAGGDGADGVVIVWEYA